MAHIIEIPNSSGKGVKRKVMYETRSLNGKRTRKSRTFPEGTPLKTVMQFKKQMEYEYEIGSNMSLEGEKKTIEAFCNEYFEIFTLGLSPTTINGYKTICYSKNGILGFFEPNMKLSQITMVHLQNYLNYLGKIGKARKTIVNTRGFLSILFMKAYKTGYITTNPAKDLEIPFNAKAKEEEKFMDIETARLALEYSAQLGGEYETVEWLGLLAGLRRGEMSGLRFQNIYTDNGHSEIHVVETRVSNRSCVITKVPKTKAGKRIVQIPTILAEVLKRKKREYELKRLKAGGDFMDEGYVFCDAHGKPVHPDTIYYRHHKFMEMFLEKYPDKEYVKLHGLRHSYCTIAVDIGMPIKSVMSQMGHSEIQTTLNCYAHNIEASKKLGAEKINEVFAERMCM